MFGGGKLQGSVIRARFVSMCFVSLVGEGRGRVPTAGFMFGFIPFVTCDV